MFDFYLGLPHMQLLPTVAWLPQRDVLVITYFGYKGKTVYVTAGSSLSLFGDHVCVSQGEATGSGYNRVQRGPPPRAVPNPRDPSYSHFPEVCVLLNRAYS